MTWRPGSLAVRLLAVLCLTAGCAAGRRTQQEDSKKSDTSDRLQEDIFAAQRVPSGDHPASGQGATGNANGDHTQIVTDSCGNLTHIFRTVLQPIRGKLAALKGHLDAYQVQLDGLAVRQQTSVSALTGRLAEAHRLTRHHPRDCSDLPAGSPSGVHTIWPGSRRFQPPVAAYCEMDFEGGGWTVIQRRADIEPRQDFNLDWEDYKYGFGDLAGEFWWGLKYIWLMTSVSDRQYQLRIDLEAFNDSYVIETGEKGYAVYRNFRISSEEEGYKLNAVFIPYVEHFRREYARDGLRNDIGHKFSTRDRDQDGDRDVHCAASLLRAGWWFGRDCGASSLNGPYRNYSGGRRDPIGVAWRSWIGFRSLKGARMMIRRAGFQPKRF